MIEFRDVCINKENFSLKNITLQIEEGSSYAILGPSGAGKSTLVKALLGLERVSSGAIFYQGSDISRASVEERGFGYVPQNLALFPHLSVQENLLFNHKKEPPLFYQLIDAANIAHLLNRYPDSLSGGERQRVALVRALLANSKVLILDEPFSALDISLKKELWMVVRELQKSFAMTLLLITHDLNEAYFLSDRVALLQDGKLLESALTKELFSKPKCVEVASYLGMKNIFPITKLDSHSFLISELERQYRVEYELKSNITHLIIPSEAICFQKKRQKEFLEGSYEILEFQNYNLILFKLSNKKVVLEMEIAKEKEVSNYISLDPQKFFYVTTCN